MNREKIYFPAVAAKTFGLKPGGYIHFMMEADRLYFYIDDDITGFMIAKGTETGIGTSVRVATAAAIEALIKRYPSIKTGKKFPLRQSNTSANGFRLVEIMLHTKI